MRQHVKTKDKAKQQIIRDMKAVADRTPMPRPTVFRDKSKYNRQSSKMDARRVMEAY